MEKNDNTFELKELIGENKFKEVLKVLLKNKEKLKNRNLVNELYLLKSEYENIKQKERLGLSLNKESNNEFAWKLLQLVDKIENPDEFILVDNSENVSSNRMIKFGASLTIMGVSVLGITVAIYAGFSITSIIYAIFALVLIGVTLYLYEQLS